MNKHVGEVVLEFDILFVLNLHKPFILQLVLVNVIFLAAFVRVLLLVLTVCGTHFVT